MFKKEIFKNRSLQEKFEREGYVRIPFIDEDQVQRLKDFYEQAPNTFDKGFHASMFNPESDYRKKADEQIRSVVQPKLAAFLEGYNALYGNFMVKEPGEESAMKLHQDWAYVDENQFVSLAIWFPLEDLNDKNGVLQMVPGSHSINNIVRGPGIFEPYHEVHDYLVENCLQSIYLKAGEAILWDHRVLHCSPANLSAKARVSATAILVPDNVEVNHFYQAPENDYRKIEKFKVNNDFFMNYEIGKRPANAESMGFVEYEFPSLSLTKLKQLLNIEKPANSNNFLNKLKRLITN